MRYSDNENKYIAEFYIQHYEKLSGRQQTAEINRVRTALYKELTNKLNNIFGKSYTREQVHDKLKNLKSSSKRKLAEKKAASQAAGEGLPREVCTSAAEDLVIRYLETRSGVDGLRFTLDSERPQSDTVMGADSNFYINRLKSKSTKNSASREPFGPENVPALNRIREQKSAIRKKRHRNFSSSSEDSSPYEAPKPSKRSRKEPVLFDEPLSIKGLQEKVLRAQLANLEKEAKMYKGRCLIMEKKVAAIDEFRSAISEFRMQMRGIDVSAIPLTLAADLMDTVIGNGAGQE